MNTRILLLSCLLCFAAVTAVCPVALAAAPTAAPVQVDALPPAITTIADGDSDAEAPAGSEARRRHGGNAVFAFGRNAELAAGRHADALIAIGGDADSAGEVNDAVVALAGDVRVTGPVGDGVIAILGDAYLNSSARTVVALMGDVQLGPEARVSHEAVAIGGTIKRDPAAVISGREQSISVGRIGHLEGLRTWLKRCALLGRPLALDRGVSWAWGVALGFLALYALLALLFREPMQRCIETLETRPGRSVLAALVSLVLIPVAMLLLVVTVVGILVVPFLGIALLLATLFGKAVMLAWIGRRVYRAEQLLIPLLMGGVIVLALYLVPLLGFLVYKLLGILGLGVTAYTLLLALRPPAPAPAASAAPVDAPTVDAAPAATVLGDGLLPRAGFWLRMAALFLDGMLILVVSHLVADPGPRAFFGLLALYAAVMWQLKGTTIGGSIVGLKLVRIDGKPVDWATAIARALGCLLSLAIGGLGFLWIVFDHDRQAWHDKIAGTAVVRMPRGVPLL